MMEVSPHICLFFIIIFLKQIMVLTIIFRLFLTSPPTTLPSWLLWSSWECIDLFFFPWRKVKGKSVVLPPGSGSGGTSQYLILDVCHELISTGQGQNSAGNSSDLVTSVVSSSSYPWAELLILKLCWDCLCFSFRRVLGWREAPSLVQTNWKFGAEITSPGSFESPTEQWCPGCQLHFPACLLEHLKVWLQGTQTSIPQRGSFAVPHLTQQRGASGSACSHQNNFPTPYRIGVSWGLWGSREALSWFHCLGSVMCKALIWSSCPKEKPCIIPWEYGVYTSSTVKKDRTSILCLRGDASTSFSSSLPTPKVYTTP